MRVAFPLVDQPFLRLARMSSAALTSKNYQAIIKSNSPSTIANLKSPSIQEHDKENVHDPLQVLSAVAVSSASNNEVGHPTLSNTSQSQNQNQNQNPNQNLALNDNAPNNKITAIHSPSNHLNLTTSSTTNSPFVSQNASAIDSANTPPLKKRAGAAAETLDSSYTIDSGGTVAASTCTTNLSSSVSILGSSNNDHKNSTGAHCSSPKATDLSESDTKSPDTSNTTITSISDLAPSPPPPPPSSSISNPTVGSASGSRTTVAGAPSKSLEPPPKGIFRSTSINTISPAKHKKRDSGHSAFRFPAAPSSPSKQPLATTGLGIQHMSSSDHSSSNSSNSSINASARPVTSSTFGSAQAAAGPHHDSSSGSFRQQTLKSEDSSTSSLLSSLLGAPVSAWSYSDEALSQALKLKAEQEKTKQEYYRLETRKKSLKLLSEAIQYNVPPTAIPLLFQSPNDPHVQAAISAATSGSVPLQHTATSPVSGSKVLVHAPNAVAAAVQRSSPPPKQPQQQPPVQLGPALNLGPDRDRYPSHHQRNMSLPSQAFNAPHGPQQQTTHASSGQQSIPQQPQAPVQQPVPFRPGHHHHASTSAIPQSHYTSPVRQPQGVYGPNRGGQWQSSNPNFFQPPPPQAPQSISPSSPSNSLQHIIQFHHWQPNQSKGAIASNTNTTASSSPKKEEDGQSTKRRRSITGERTGSPTPRSSSITTTSSLSSPAAAAAIAGTSGATISHTSATSSAATAAAAITSRRKTMGHSRHRSEASIPHSASWANLARRRGVADSTSGVNILAAVATASQDEDRQREDKGEKTDERRRKHGVDFMISDN